MSDKSAELKLALSIADEARLLALQQWRNTKISKNKASDGGFDPTTEADILIEKIMQERIGNAFPKHQIYGEELPIINEGANPKWVVDPIDGTRNYYAGSLFWGILIALIDGFDAKLGVIDHPPTGERFFAENNRGFWVKGDEIKPLQTKNTSELKNAVLAATTPQMFNNNELALFNKLSGQAAITLYGGNCYFYGLLALGKIDCVVEAGLQLYDIAALVPVVESAGGVITDWHGDDALGQKTKKLTGRVVASANPILHKKLLAMLSDISA